ncbi:MAG: 2Fe-2S iron-sulfur cluster-binding protein [candidate division Zixibacteria bacterium]
MSGCDSEQARIINSPTGTPDLSVLDVQTLLTQAIDAAEQIGAVVTVAVVDREANDTGHITLIPVSAPQPAIPEPKAAEAAPAAADGAPAVTFKNDGRTFPIQPGQTICEIAEANGYTINAECHAGMCGSDPIKVISGQENLSDIGDAEEEALEDICELKPGECRLACMAKVKGPVEIEIIEQ